MRILIVDDDPPLVDVLALDLHAMGFEVITTTSGVSALEIVATTWVDVVLTDFLIWPIDGVELATRLSVLRPGLPVFLMMGTPRFLLLTPPGIFAGIFEKPFRLDVLVAAICETVRRRV